MEWLVGALLITLYLVCLFTICSMTFRKGYSLLGILGIFFPILWIIGAIMPAKPGSRQRIAQESMAAAQMRDMTA